MLAPVDIHYIAEVLARLGEEIQCAADDLDETIDPRPDVLISGLESLLDTLDAAQADSADATVHELRKHTGCEPEALLAHGLDLLSRLAEVARSLQQPQSARELEQLSLPLACWLIRRGAELVSPEPVVDAATALANGLHEPDDLAELYALMSEIVDGMSPLHTLEPEGAGPTRPWRALLLNRANVATRSHRPMLMAEAFESVCEHLPDDAPGFFQESMGQMEALDYPQPVREVMERYYKLLCAGQQLH